LQKPPAFFPAELVSSPKTAAGNDFPEVKFTAVSGFYKLFFRQIGEIP